MKNNQNENDMKKIKKERLKKARIKFTDKQLPNNFFENILNYEMILSNGFDFECLKALIELYSVNKFDII